MSLDCMSKLGMLEVVQMKPDNERVEGKLLFDPHLTCYLAKSMKDESLFFYVPFDSLFGFPENLRPQY